MKLCANFMCVCVRVYLETEKMICGYMYGISHLVFILHLWNVWDSSKKLPFYSFLKERCSRSKVIIINLLNVAWLCMLTDSHFLWTISFDGPLLKTCPGKKGCLRICFYSHLTTTFWSCRWHVLETKFWSSPSFFAFVYAFYVNHKCSHSEPAWHDSWIFLLSFYDSCLSYVVK